jgi:pimeloyl-ACP methyl ester carboxylesterase
VHQLILKEGWESAHLVGHSLGGLVALNFAIHYKALARSLALLCTFGDGRVPTRPSARLAWMGLKTRIGSRRRRRAAFLELIMPREALAARDREQLAEELAPLFGHDLADQPSIALPQLLAARRCNVMPELRDQVKIPTLVVSAEHDPIAPPRFGQALANEIHGARFVLLEDSSHGAPIHRSETINALLIEHMMQAERP